MYSPKEMLEISDLRARLEEIYKTPHYYVPTDPYKGCGVCGIGPGAYVHNDFNVEAYNAKMGV